LSLTPIIIFLLFCMILCGIDGVFHGYNISRIMDLVANAC
jgi:hypothetical protein